MKTKNKEVSVINTIKELIEQKRNIFITGGGGVGKSYLIKEIRQLYPDAAITSTTGISAINIEGQTLHSWSGIGIGDKNERTQAFMVMKNKEKLKKLQETKLLVIDEISMLDATLFKYLDDYLSIVRKNPHTFGGIQVILIGDFFQLPPVGIEYGKKYCFESPLWKKLNLVVITLDEVYRQKDKSLINALNDIREGNTSKQSIKLLSTRNEVTPPKEAVRIYPTKSETDSYNYRCYDAVSGEEKVYWAYDSYTKNGNTLNPNFDKLSSTEITAYESFDSACNTPKLLKLKVGVRVMLLSNIDIKAGLVNGSCGVVSELEDKHIEVIFDNGVKRKLTRIVTTLNKNEHSKFSRTQFPLKLAYACTIHKAQGKTFDKIFVNLASIFTSGQTYVALSRVTSLDGLYLKNFNESKIKADNKVIEFYKSIV